MGEPTALPETERSFALMPHRAHLEALHRRFNPLRPAGDPGDPEVTRVERPYSPLDALVRDFGRPFGIRKELVYGPPGSGKSTELLALVSRVSPQQYLTVFLDLRDHFEDHRGDAAALNLLQPWEVLAVIGLAVHRFGVDHLGHEWQRAQTERLRSALASPAGLAPADVNVGQLAKEVALLVASATVDTLTPSLGFGLKALAAVAASVSHKLPLGIPSRDALPDQHGQVQDLKNAVAALLDELEIKFEREMLLVVDGLDRGDRDLARRMFEDSHILADLPCHLVLSAPQSLRHRNVRTFEPRAICNIPVVDHERPPGQGSGTAFFWDVWSARARAGGAPDTLAERAGIERLGWASGGFIRTFLEMVQDTVELAWDDDSAITSEHVARVVDRWRLRWEEDVHGIWREALGEISRTLQLDGSDLHRVLLEQRCVVAFPNESLWYYPHPLLTLRAVPVGG